MLFDATRENIARDIRNIHQEAELQIELVSLSYRFKWKAIR
jgi:hypothetical protein